MESHHTSNVFYFHWEIFLSWDNYKLHQPGSIRFQHKFWISLLSRWKESLLNNYILFDIFQILKMMSTDKNRSRFQVLIFERGDLRLECRGPNTSASFKWLYLRFLEPMLLFFAHYLRHASLILKNKVSLYIQYIGSEYPTKTTIPNNQITSQ